MTTHVHTGMSTDLNPLLSLIWLASPALPVGGFSYSEGLEAAVSSGFVHDADTAEIWLSEQLWLTLARGDLSVLCAFIQAWRSKDTDSTKRIVDLNEWVQQTRESAELNLQTEQMGRSLLDWLRQRHWCDETKLHLCQIIGPTYPMVMGLAMASTAADERSALMSYAFGWAENMTQAAIKSVPLGQSAGQKILAALSEQIPDAVNAARARSDETRQSFSPMLAILSAQHETQYSRLFRS